MSQNPVPPTTQEQTIACLLECFSELPTQLQITARYIIDHPYEVGVQTMRTLATRAGVHPNSFVRLARYLGFEGYDAMRERFRDFVRSGTGSSEDRARWLQVMARQGGNAKIVGQMAASMISNLEQMMQDQDMGKLDKVVRWMMQSQRVYILGVGAGYPLAYNFWYVARMIRENFILIPRHGSLPMDDVTSIGKRDLLFAMTFQPYRTDVVETLRYAGQQGARTIGLSDSPAATIFRESDLGLYAPTHTPQFFHSNSSVNLRWQSGIYEE
jgi:DNA-binding MurR/RpiR family transcriptional regulator